MSPDSACFSKKKVPRFGGETAEVLLQWLAPKHVTVSACIELRDKDDPQEVEYLKPITKPFNASKIQPNPKDLGSSNGKV